jgi:hypothetical protein
MSAAYYLHATQEPKVPQSRFDDWSEAKWEQSVQTNRSEALRYFGPAKEIDPTLTSVVDVMVKSYQVSETDAWKALEELDPKK